LDTALSLSAYVLAILAVCTTSVSMNLSAQSAVQSSLFNQNIMPFNPAFAGSKLGLNMDASLRYQWLDLEGAPISQFGSVHLAAPGINAGDFRFGSISFGADMGISQKSLDGSLIRTGDGSYTDIIEHNDALISNSNQSGISPDLGLGVVVRFKSTLFGLSARSLLLKKFQLAENDALVEDGSTFFGFLQQKIEIGYNFELLPSLLLKSDLLSHQMDVQIAAIYRELFKLGLGYRGYNNRTQDAIVLLAGDQFTTNLGLTYGYDLGLSGLNSAHLGSHELAVSYRLADLSSSKGAKVIYNPRFL